MKVEDYPPNGEMIYRHRSDIEHEIKPAIEITNELNQTINAAITQSINMGIHITSLELAPVTDYAKEPIDETKVAIHVIIRGRKKA